jgi:hypothetical protein
MDSLQNNTHTLNDPSPQGTSNDLFYSVYVKHPSGCTAYDANKNYNSARSNRSGPPPPPAFPDTSVIDTTDTSSFVAPINGFDQITLYPTPTLNDVNLVFNSTINSIVYFKILNFHGAAILSKQIVVNQGKNHVKLSLKGLAKGAYLLKGVSGFGQFSHMILLE